MQKAGCPFIMDKKMRPLWFGWMFIHNPSDICLNQKENPIKYGNIIYIIQNK